MVEADLYCLMGLFFSAFVSLGSMTLYWFFEVRPGWDWLADALAITWIGVGMSVVAWMKVWMAKPSFNTGKLFIYRFLLWRFSMLLSLQHDGYYLVRRVSKLELGNKSFIFPDSILL
jgi:hypothetical protein